MAGHIAQGTGAEVPPTAMLERVIEAGPEFTRRSNAEPVRPIDANHRLFDLFLLLGDQLVGVRRIVLLRLRGELLQRHAATRALRPDRAVRPSVHFLQRAEHARLDLGDRFARRIERGPLVPHLRADAGFLGDFGELAGFVDGAGQRLLRVAADAEAHAGQRDRTVHVVRGADRGDVDLLAVLGQQLAIVSKAFGVLEALGFAFAFERVAIDVADGDDVAELRGVVRIAAALAADAEAGDVQLFVGRALLAAQIDGPPDEDAGSDRRCGLNKIATRYLSTHTSLLAG